jgi:hypothetical protein
MIRRVLQRRNRLLPSIVYRGSSMPFQPPARRGRTLLTLAALSVFLATGGCDAAAANFIMSGLLNVAAGVGSLFVSSAIQVLLQSFPSADILQALLGGIRDPYFTG